MYRDVILSLLLSLAAVAQSNYEHGVMVRVGNIYIAPDVKAAQVGQADRGREVIILGSSGDFLHVQANVTEEKTVGGWMLSKGIVRPSTPDGDKIAFGEAVDSEDEGSRRDGRRGAADDARRLYYRVYDIFPNSPLAGEALYRAADIKWQIDRADVMSKPSAKEQESWMRGEIEEHWMKEVIKKFPGTRWADLASYHLIENKLCGNWQGNPKCPEKEADIYEKYAGEHPQSPKAAEALYNAASRYGALIEIYKGQDQTKKSDESRARSIALCQKIISQYAQSDYGARAQALLYMTQQGIPTFGNAVD
jgi:outer membrane protein assembly factor BamD (BamD/ComL family)